MIRSLLRAASTFRNELAWASSAWRAMPARPRHGRPLRILVVGMANSIHLARYLSQIQHTGWDIHLFNSNPIWGACHADLRNVTLHGCVSWPAPNAHPSVELEGFWPFAHGIKVA